MFLKNLNTMDAVKLTTIGESPDDYAAIEVEALHIDPLVVQNQFAEVGLPNPDGGTQQFILFNVTVPLPIKKSVFFKKTLITPDSVSDGLTKTCPIAPKVTVVIKKSDIKKAVKFLTDPSDALQEEH